MPNLMSPASPWLPVPAYGALVLGIVGTYAVMFAAPLAVILSYAMALVLARKDGRRRLLLHVGAFMGLWAGLTVVMLGVLVLGLEASAAQAEMRVYGFDLLSAEGTPFDTARDILFWLACVTAVGGELGLFLLRRRRANEMGDAASS